MALFLFILFVSVCVFLRLIRGLLLWGIKFLFFLLLLISHREQLLLVQGHQMRDLPPTPINRSSALDSPFSIKKSPYQRRAEAPG